MFIPSLWFEAYWQRWLIFDTTMDFSCLISIFYPTAQNCACQRKPTHEWHMNWRESAGELFTDQNLLSYDFRLDFPLLGLTTVGRVYHKKTGFAKCSLLLVKLEGKCAHICFKSGPGASIESHIRGMELRFTAIVLSH